MINYEKVAEKIFSIIKGHDHDLVMFTEDGMETSSAEEARRFFVSKPNYMVTLDGEARHIKINKNSNVSLEDMESVMKQLKNLATSNMLKTEIRVFGKQITPKDFAYQTKNLKEPAMENIQEASFSRMHGFKKTSYQTLESTKIVVRHRHPIDEEVQGSRARNIQAIFIEHAGERFRFPHNNLAGARAMARHINEGGEMHDSIGKYIIESISNYNKLMEFVRYARTNKLINEESEDVVKTVRESMGIIRREIGQLQGAKTYESMRKRIEESDVNVIEETGEDVSDLQDMFTVRKFDEEIGNVLPIVKKLMDNKQEWRDSLVEASEKQIYISEKSGISETEVFEFDSPVQRMGYRVKDIADRMIGESDLQTFVGKVAGKLIEGEEISAFEKKVVGNVLGNAVLREEEEICEECGEVMENCGCSTKDVVELISDSFELKMKMLEHEDIFTESNVLSTRECPNCGDYAMDLQDRYGDDLFYVCDTCGEEMQDRIVDLPDVVACPSCRDEAFSFSNNTCDTCGYTEDEAAYMYEDDHADEVAAGAHSGMPKGDFDVNTTDVSELADMVIDDLAGDFDDPDTILRAVVHLLGSDDPAVDDVYQEVLDKVNFQDYDDGQPTEYEEWQDVYGGDDWDFGQYDEALEEGVGDWMKDKMLNMMYKRLGSAGPEALAAEIKKEGKEESMKRILKDWLLTNMEKELGSDKYMFFIRVSKLLDGDAVEEDFERDRPDRDYSSLSGHSDCPSCNGTGANTGRDMLTKGWNCPDCRGTGKVLEGKYTGFGDIAPGKAERDPCPHCKGTGEPEEPGGWDDLDDLGLCMMCDGSGKLPYVKGSKQDPFGGNYGVDVEDFMDGDEDDIF